MRGALFRELSTLMSSLSYTQLDLSCACLYPHVTSCRRSGPASRNRGLSHVMSTFHCNSVHSAAYREGGGHTWHAGSGRPRPIQASGGAQVICFMPLSCESSIEPMMSSRNSSLEPNSDLANLFTVLSRIYHRVHRIFRHGML